MVFRPIFEYCLSSFNRTLLELKFVWDWYKNSIIKDLQSHLTGIEISK